MTAEQWLALEVGDVVIDLKCGGAERKVLAVKRVSGSRGQRRGQTRTTITVMNLKTPGTKTHIFSTEDSPRGTRFQYSPRCKARVITAARAQFICSAAPHHEGECRP